MNIKNIATWLFLLSALVIAFSCTSLKYDARQDKELQHIKDSLSRKVDSLVAEASKGYDDMYGGDETPAPVVKIDSTKLKQKIADVQKMRDSLAVIMKNIIVNHLENDAANKAIVDRYKNKINQLQNEIDNTPPDTIRILTPAQDAAAKIDSVMQNGGKSSWIAWAAFAGLFVLAMLALYFKNKQSTSQKV